MTRVAVVFCFLMFFCFCSVAMAGPEVQAPLGFQWGMTVSEVEQLGLGTIQNMGGNLYLVHKTPKQLPNTDYASLAFSSKGLVQVAWFSTIVEGESALRVLMDRYDTIKKTLVEKFGPPEFGGEFFDKNRPKKDIQHFLACLSEGSNCGMWKSAWKVNGIYISVSIAPSSDSGDKGFVGVAYTSLSGMELRAKEQAALKDAL